MGGLAEYLSLFCYKMLYLSYVTKIALKSNSWHEYVKILPYIYRTLLWGSFQNVTKYLKKASVLSIFIRHYDYYTPSYDKRIDLHICGNLRKEYPL